MGYLKYHNTSNVCLPKGLGILRTRLTKLVLLCQKSQPILKFYYRVGTGKQLNI